MAMLRRVVHSLGFAENTNNKESKSKSKKKGSKAYREFSSISKDFVVRLNHEGGQQEVFRHAVPVCKLMTKYPGMCIARPEVFKLPHQSVLWRDDILVPGHKYILISFKDVDKLKSKYPEQNQTKEDKEKNTLDTKAKSPSGHNEHKENGKESGHHHRENINRSPNGHHHSEIINRSPNGHQHHHKENGKMEEINNVLEPEGNKRVDEYVGGEVLEESFVPAKDYYIPKEKPARSLRRRGLRAKKPFVPPLPKARHYRSLRWQPNLPTVKELSP